RLRHVDRANVGAGRDRARRQRRVVPADRHQMRHAVLFERIDDGHHRLFGSGRVFARRAEHRAAAQMDARNVVNQEWPGLRRVAPRLTSHLKPSCTPRTSKPSLIALIVTEEMTALMPGAGPPPTRIANLPADDIESFS